MPNTPLTIADLFLDWGLGATSLFNTIILLWLGLTVWLNAERRAWGTMLAGTGMLLGGTFFLIHAATLDYTWEALFRGIRSWWYACWVCVLALPLGWYVLMLWYAGFWNRETRVALPALRRHWAGFFLALSLALLLATLVFVVNPLRIFAQVANRENNQLSLYGIPLLLVACPLYLLICLCLSLDALNSTGPANQRASKALDDLARRRARPWLMASTGVQLLASLCVGGLLLWIVWKAHFYDLNEMRGRISQMVMLFDLLISSLVAVAVVLMGKAIVSYEIFTGKTLPRRGFLRQWRNIVSVAAAYSVLVALAWALPVPSVYPLLLSMLLLSVFFALFSWHGYAERETYVAQLRPFVASQGLYEQLLDNDGELEKPNDDNAPFRALCADILGVEAAYLVAVGSLAPLVGMPLVYPAGRRVGAPPLDEILPQLSPQTMCIALDPAQTGGIVWAVPLWSERGLIGVFLLGEKHDGGLYTQEEIEIARASGERLIDTQASAALAQRLMSLQRERLAQNMMLDRRARRVLHDDVLPRLHAIMLTFQNAPPEALEQLGQAHHEISNLLREMPGATTPAVARLGLIEALKQVAQEEHNADFDEVIFDTSAQAESIVRGLPQLTQETLFYAAREALRNAARHAQSAEASTPLEIRIALAAQDGLQIMIEDNGIGLENAAHAQNPGGGTTGGSGQGLALHGAMMAILGGTLSLETRSEGGTRVMLHLPSSALNLSQN
ncbi:MAG TPA: ATP-binding protein [Abditibacteriaceae bacterium]|jgi:signal transduction histidine kinase